MIKSSAASETRCVDESIDVEMPDVATTLANHEGASPLGEKQDENDMSANMCWSNHETEKDATPDQASC